MLSYVAKSMLNTAHTLLVWAQEPDGRSFAQSAYARSRDLLLPFYKLIVRRAPNPSDGFIVRSEDCHEAVEGSAAKTPRCEECSKRKKTSYNHVSQQHDPRPKLPDRSTRIDYIARNPQLAELEIRHLRERLRQANRKNAKLVMEKELEENGIRLYGRKAERMQKAVEKMSPVIEKAFENSGDHEAQQLWEIQRDRMNAIHANGGRKRGRNVEVHPVIMSWAIAFLARTSQPVYREVAKIMLLPDIRHVQRESAKLVSRAADKAQFMCIATMRTMKQRAAEEKWSENARTGCISFDSANINAGIDHDLVTNSLVGGDESHGLASLSRMFHAMAAKVKKASEEENESLLAEQAQSEEAESEKKKVSV